MIHDRYYLTKNTEELLQYWYNNGKIIEVNKQIDDVLFCVDKYKIKWNKMQRKLFNIIIKEI